MVFFNMEKFIVEIVLVLEYDVYFFSNYLVVNVMFYIFLVLNYLGDYNLFEYVVVLYFKGGDEKVVNVRFVGLMVGMGMLVGWQNVVVDQVWGVRGWYIISIFEVLREGVYMLRIWVLMLGVVVQKVVIDVGGVRESYFGLLESFLVGRDEVGGYNGMMILNEVDIIGGWKGDLKGGYGQQGGVGWWING